MEAAQRKFNLPHKNMWKGDNKRSCSMFGILMSISLESKSDSNAESTIDVKETVSVRFGERIAKCGCESVNNVYNEQNLTWHDILYFHALHWHTITNRESIQNLLNKNK